MAGIPFPVPSPLCPPHNTRAVACNALFPLPLPCPGTHVLGTYGLSECLLLFGKNDPMFAETDFQRTAKQKLAGKG